MTYYNGATIDEIASETANKEEAEAEEIRQHVEAWEKAKKDNAKITLEITAEELEEIQDALNFYAVNYYREKMDEETQSGGGCGFWRKRWECNLSAFMKAYEAEKETANRYK